MKQRLTLGILVLPAARQGLLLTFAAMVVYPFLVLVLTSLKTTSEVIANPLGLPSRLAWENYAAVLREANMLRYFFNSVIVTVIANALILLCSGLVAYSVVRLSGWLGTVLFAFFALGMTIPTQTNMIPLYVLLAKLNMLNSLYSLSLVYVAFALPFSVFVLSGFMRTISISLVEAAKLDGASEWQVLRRIFLPLSAPAFATVGILGFVRTWNDLLFPLLLIRREPLRTLPLALLRFQGEYSVEYPLLFAGVIVALIPLLTAHLFLQRYFVEGLTAGGLKG